MKNKVINIVIITLFLSSPLFAQGSESEWLIIPGVSVGKISAKTSEAILIKLFGIRNVESANIERGEGETTLGTILFPNDPEKKLEIIWENPETKSKPLYVLIRGRHRTIWKTKNGISLGTSLKEIERINGKPFTLAGFGWDGQGTIYDFNGGKLCAAGYCQEFDEHGNYKKKRIYIAVEAEVDFNDKGFIRLYHQVQGDRRFSSGHPAMQQLNPTVTIMSITMNE